MGDIVEYRFKVDYKSPNSATKNNNVVFHEFKRGQTIAGYPLNRQNSNIGTQLSAHSTIVGKGNWLIPLSKLERASKKSWESFEEYTKDTAKIKADDLPPEILEKINDIANKNLALKASKAVKSNLKLAMVGLGGGLLYAFIAKKNVYLWGMGGLIGGILITVLQAPKEPK